MKLIVGLGNPGKKYTKTRHNVGFMVLDMLHEAFSEYQVNSWELSKKFNAEIAGCSMHGDKVVLAKPMTYMNASGQSVALIAHFYQLSHDDIIVVHDDKDIKLGDVKVQKDRGDAGHNGIKSIIEHIGGKDFTRVRVGVAPEDPAKIKNTADFVLKKFGLLERKKVEAVIGQTVEEILKLLE